ncbi:hypothetical protein BDR06DRAFT_954007 [Suillus hirtellus]|nr:hypothetical protein BDR06DRAFT_954007 [Suillus hirtellus]
MDSASHILPLNVSENQHRATKQSRIWTRPKAFEELCYFRRYTRHKVLAVCITICSAVVSRTNTRRDPDDMLEVDQHRENDGPDGKEDDVHDLQSLECEHDHNGTKD